MTVVALVGTKGAPGVSTLACAVGAVWPAGREIVVAECDPSGGDLAARFGLSAELGMASLVVALRHGRTPEDATAGRDHVHDHVQRLPGGLAALTGAIGADAGSALDRELATVGMADVTAIDVVADCGRMDVHAAGQQRVLREADRVLLVLRAEPSALAHGRWAVERLLALRAPNRLPLGLVVARGGSFRSGDIADALGVELSGSLPEDASAAAMLCGRPGANRILARSALVGAAKRLVPALLSDVGTTELRDVS